MNLTELIALLLPLVLLELGLMLFAVFDLFKAERRVKGGNKLIWLLIIVLLSLLGPLLYFIAGREDN